ncbi:hypothetical protein Cus16_2959 [Curtobacterium sp. ER1/6]|nr:hypothetical protein Cus16_2959 [Curtobacterium sp. ER1/6]
MRPGHAVVLAAPTPGRAGGPGTGRDEPCDGVDRAEPPGVPGDRLRDDAQDPTERRDRADVDRGPQRSGVELDAAGGAAGVDVDDGHGVEPVGAGHVRGDDLVRCEQDARPVGLLHEDVREGTERRTLPHPDDEPHARRRPDARDPTTEPTFDDVGAGRHALDRTRRSREPTRRGRAVPPGRVTTGRRRATTGDRRCRTYSVCPERAAPARPAHAPALRHRHRLGEELAHPRGDPRAVELDRPHHVLVRQATGRVPHVEARDPEDPHVARDLPRHRLRRPDVQRTAGGEPGLVLGGVEGRPPALASEPVGDGLVVRPVALGRFLVGLGDEARRVHGDGLLRELQLRERLTVEPREGGELRRLPADDGEEERQAVRGRADDRLGRAADADPRRDRTVLELRVDVLVGERGALRAGPRDGVPAAERVPELQLLLEQDLVVGQVVAEQREGLGERAPAEDHLGATVGERVHRREPLVDADRVVRGQHGDRGAHPDRRGPGRDGGEHDLRGADDEVLAVVLTHADEVDADLVGEDGLVDDVADGLRVGPEGAVGALGDVAEGVEAELHRADAVGCGRRDVRGAAGSECIAHRVLQVNAYA